MRASVLLVFCLCYISVCFLFQYFFILFFPQVFITHIFCYFCQILFFIIELLFIFLFCTSDGKKICLKCYVSFRFLLQLYIFFSSVVGYIVHLSSILSSFSPFPLVFARQMLLSLLSIFQLVLSLHFKLFSLSCHLICLVAGQRVVYSVLTHSFLPV